MQRSRAQSADAETERATAILQQAQLNLQYTTVVAPVSGIVGQRSVQPGQNVAPGQQMMTIVPLDSQNIWVTANFKETQLKHMRPGQRARISVDTYGRKYDGHVLKRSRRLRGALQLATARECDGKLCQGRPANTREDCGRKGAGPRALAETRNVRGTKRKSPISRPPPSSRPQDVEKSAGNF